MIQLSRTCLVLTILIAICSPVQAEIFFGPIYDPDASGGGFFGTDIYTWGDYSLNDAATVEGNNAVLRVASGFETPGIHGAAMSVHISNGENGNSGDDPANPDGFNFAPAHDGFTTIGNPSGRLENGNAIRYSFWMKQDPNDLVQAAPSIEPVVKLEFWTEALQATADNSLNSNPVIADRVYDTQLQGSSASFIDMNGDGSVNNRAGGGGETFTLNTEWTLVSTTYIVDDSGWGYNYASGFVGKTVADIEEVRGTMYWSEFDTNDLTNGGSILIDQPMLEIYQERGLVPVEVPNPFPSNLIDPDFDENGSLECNDIDQLTAEIASESNNPSFDLTGDGLVDGADLVDWLAQAGAMNLDSGASYLFGDANLDGAVDVSDFNLWNSSKFSDTPAWCSGDFNADGSIDVSDFNLWNGNKFQNADAVASVPEPSSWLLLVIGLLLPLRQHRRS